MSHHVETAGTDRIYNLRPLVRICNLELLLKEDRRLLFGRSYYA